MPSRKQMSESDKAKIIAFRELNLSFSQISRKLGYNASTLSRFFKNYESTGSIKRKIRTRNARITSAGQDRVLKRICLKDRFKSSQEIRNEFVEQCGVDISARTVRRRLVESGLMARRPAKKPFLTRKMRQKRLEWAKQHRNWTVEDWRNVIFSDESKFNLFGSDGMTYVRRKSSERLSAVCIRQTRRQGGSRMVWGCFSYYGVGQLALIEGTVNGIAYKNILEKYLIPSTEMLYSHTDELKFQDDSAPCHRCKIVKDYLHEVGISAVEWPGNSPDLNPIENLWHFMKVQVTKKKPKTLPELDKIIEDLWYNGIPPSTLRNLIDSMPDRINAVIKQRGGPTKY